MNVERKIIVKLHELYHSPGSKRVKKRIGRGAGSGWGKTAGKGHKGQNARSGGGVKAGFEGGQMPFQRRVPKRGFRNIFEKKYARVNVGDFANFEAGSKIDFELLKKAGILKRPFDGLKVLGNGEVSKKFHVVAAKFSKSAKQKIETAQGKAEVK